MENLLLGGERARHREGEGQELLMRVTSLTDHRTQTLCICNFDQIKNYTGLYDAIKKYVI